MNGARRRFLAIGAVASLCLLSPAWSTAPRGRTPALHLLRTGTPLDEAFAAGAAAALTATGQAASARKGLHVRSLAGRRMDSFSQALTLAHGSCVIAILTEADHMIFNEALREAGGAVLCQGMHGIAPRLDQARHHFISLSSSQGIGTAVARAIARDGEPASVSEQAMHTPCDAVGALSLVRQPAGWPAVVGQALALVADGRWIPGQVRQSSAATSAGERPPRAAVHYISLAVQA